MLKISFITLCGLALLLGGILIMRLGLSHLLLPRLRQALSACSCTPWRGLLFGTAAAAALQSSTALSLLTIGLVNAEYLSFRQGLGIILGANIGTCTTVQLMSLSPSPSLFYIALPLALLLAACCPPWRYSALAVAGLCSLFLGLMTLAQALAAAADLLPVENWLEEAAQNPWLGMTCGLALTVLLQSSSAATGLFMQLGDNNCSLAAAAYLIYGSNIGACLSSVVAAAASSTAARRLAAAHLLLNFGGAAAFLPLTPLIGNAAIALSEDFAVQVAAIHTLFNVISSLAVLPFADSYARLISRLIPRR